jgi:hypothetical protein
MRSLWEYVRFPLEILGAIATIFVIYQAISFVFFKKRVNSASYKLAILAQDGSVFGARLFLQPVISDWKEMVRTALFSTETYNPTSRSF